MAYVVLSNGYDSEYHEAQGRVSKSKPVMGIVIDENMVVGVLQGTMSDVKTLAKQGWGVTDFRDTRRSKK